MSYIITLPYDPTWPALDWAKRHCPSYITNDMHREKGPEIATRIDYFFAEERDAVLFALRWS